MKEEKESTHTGRFPVSSQTSVLVIIFVALLIYPWVFTKPFPRHLAIMIFLYALMGSAWNVVGGYMGQVSLGHAVFFALGAYTSSILLIKLNISPWLGMVAGILVALAVAMVIGYACFRLGGRYFSMATVVIGEIVRTVFINWRWVGGACGLYLPLLPDSFLNLEFHVSKIPYYYIILTFLVVNIVATHVMEKSRLGYYFKAIRDDPEAAQSLGINILKYKLVGLAFSVIFTAIAGTLYAQYVLFIDPTSTMPFLVSLRIALVAILGGLGTLWGPIIGAFVLIPISEATRIRFSGGGRAFDLVVLGALIVLFAVFQPRGLVAMLRRHGRKLDYGTSRNR